MFTIGLYQEVNMFYCKVDNNLLSSIAPLDDDQYIEITQEEYNQLLEEKSLFREEGLGITIQINTIF